MKALSKFLHFIIAESTLYSVCSW